MIYILVLLFSFVASTAEAACGGSSPNLTAATWADIGACHTAATNGDTITYTGGNATVTTTHAISKHVIIVGGGATITDNSTAGEGGVDLIAITESTSGSTKLSGFTFIPGTGVHTGTSAIVSMLFASGGKPILVTGNTFSFTTPGANGNAMRATTNRGVIWLNTFTGVPASGQCLNNLGALRHKPGAGSWFTAATFGNADTNGDQNLYFENNIIDTVQEGIDGDDGARTVVRFNTITNSGSLTHGDTSFPGGRYLDVYKNTFVKDTTVQANCTSGYWTNVNAWLTWRAGTGHVLDNTLPNLDDGLWGTKTEVNFRVDALHRSGGGPCACYAGTYPFPAQTGWGYTAGGTAAGSTCAGSGIVQDLQPIYLAGNIGGFTAGAQDYPNECGGGAQSASTYLQANRDYYLTAGTVQTSATSPFNGTVGTGYGTLANRPTTCTAGSTSAAGVGYWATDQGSWNTSGTSGGGQTQQGLFYRCTATNTWTLAYTPYTYPHPLTAGAAVIAPPSMIGGVGAVGGVTIK